MVIALFIFVHWYVSGFCQSFFLHRYASHRMFSMPVFWERFFYVLNMASQGIVCIPPKTYAVMHRMHHAYADTAEDPHSPQIHKNPFKMAFNTVTVFFGLFTQPLKSEPRFDLDHPSWPAMDQLIARRSFRFVWSFAMICSFVWFYHRFAPAKWFYIFLPVHFFIGLINGTVTNWCGHRYGYRNFNSHNMSKNLFALDIFMLGESLHNNHHSQPWRTNFAFKKFEWDPTFEIAKLLSLLGVLRFNDEPKMR